MRKNSLNNKKSYILSYLLLIIGGIVVVYPIIFMFLGGFFTSEEYMTTVITLFPVAKNPTLKNYLGIFDLSRADNLSIYFVNSVIRTTIAVISTIITSIICGFVFARLKFKIRRTLFLVLLFTTMIPGTVTLVPTYLMYAKWPFAGGNNIFTGGSGILNTWAVYLIGCPSINILATFFVKQYLESIPTSIDEAVKIDGGGYFCLMFKILMPLIKPAIGYVAITTAMAAWGDWSTGFFFVTSEKLQMLPSALAKLSTEGAVNGMPNYPSMLTIGLASTIPALLIYFIFQKQIVEGIAATGMKD